MQSKDTNSSSSSNSTSMLPKKQQKMQLFEELKTFMPVALFLRTFLPVHFSEKIEEEMLMQT